MLIFPLIGAVSAYGLLDSTKRRNDPAPFRFAALIFIAAFGRWPARSALHDPVSR